MAERRRLHRAAIAVYTTQALGNAALPLFVIAAISLFGGGFDAKGLLQSAIYGAAGVAIAFATGLVRWRTTTYWVDGEAVGHRSGLLRISQTTVPLARVEALDVHQGLVQRAFGVVAVEVQTGGGRKGGEISLPALAPAAVRELRDRVGVAAPSAPDASRMLTGRALLVAALTAGQLGVILPVLAVAGQIAQQVFEQEGGERAVDALPRSVLAWAAIVAALLLAAWVLSVAGALVAFAGFTVARDADRLRIRRGMLQRREATIPVERVRAIRMVEGLLRQPFGLAALHIEVTGYADEAAAARTLYPLVRVCDVRATLEELLPELADHPGGLARPPRRARRRYLLGPALAGLALSAAGWIWLGPWCVVLLPLALAAGAARWRAAGWRVRDGRLAVRARRLARTTVLAPAVNRESHTVAQNPFQRRARLATLEVAFGKKTTARIRHLEAADAFTSLPAPGPGS